MQVHWYAIHSHPRKEEHLWNQILLQGFDAFYPRLHVKPVNPRSKKIQPYFPGYLFVRADLEVSGISLFQWMPYSTGLVSFGGEPSVVPESLIQSLKRRLEEIEENGGETLDGLQSGDAVLIASGPLAGYEAIYDTRISGTERVRVLLKMLNQRNLPVDLEAHQIQRLKGKRKP